MLNQIKNYVIIALTILCAVLAVRLHFCMLENVQFKQASADAKQKSLEDNAKVRLREQEAAKSAKQSQVHMEAILNDNIKRGCQNAISYLIDNRIIVIN